MAQSTFRLALLVCSTYCLATGADGLTDLNLTPFYAQTGWPGVHRDSSNTDFSPFVAPLKNRVTWSVLDGAAVLPAPVMGPEGNLYVTTGQGQGTRHLYAFNRNGQLLWQSAPQTTLNDLDSAAALSAALVDKDGIVYIADRNQFWAFRADGSVKWVAALPGGPFASAILTKEGYVGGVTFTGNVILYNRADGTLAIPLFELPGGAGPPALPVPGGLWKGGLLDPALINDAYQMFLGRVFEVTNTPAVHPLSGRIYVVGAGRTPQSGILYGLDIVQGKISIAFEEELGPGSGTSPAISHDGKRVYAVDGSGHLMAFDAINGEKLWSAGQAANASSPTIGADDTIYTGGANLTALRPDGSVLWTRNFNSVAASVLPVLPASPPAFLTGQPVGRPNGVLTATATKLWAVIALGYEYTEPVSRGTLLQPRVSLLVSIDPATGAITGSTRLRETCEGIISVSPGGQMYVAHAAFLQSAFYHSLNSFLPPVLQMAAPVGGFSALGPQSYQDLAVEALDWTKSLNTKALSQLPLGDATLALNSVRRSLMQVHATLGTVQEAVAGDELPAASGTQANQSLIDARTHLFNARLLLGASNPTAQQLSTAATRLTQAQSKIDAALVIVRR